MSDAGDAKSVLITGASTGIGKASALHLDALGVRVFAGVRREPDGEALRREASGRLTPLPLDVTDHESIAAACDVIAEAVGKRELDGVVNNAGIHLGGPLEFTAIDDLRRILDINLVGVIAVTQAALPFLRAARGRIVNICSVSGLFALPFYGPYAASKFAMEAISDSWRVELRPWGIRVSIIEPGAVQTPFRDKAIATLCRIRDSYPPAANELYGPIFGLAERQRRTGMPVDRVTRLVAHALLSRRPKPRYLVGADARILSILRRLPTGLRDRLIASRFPDYGPTSPRADAPATTAPPAPPSQGP
jgi:NAD(P)-dependent dehydrogenase (short-subunit alcohol dehydrogenase family)